MTEIRVSGVDYIVRVEPTGLMESPAPVFSFIALTFTTLRNLVRGDKTWTVTVRKRADDPFGPTVLREVLESRASASARAGQLVDDARAGRAAWLSS